MARAARLYEENRIATPERHPSVSEPHNTSTVQKDVLGGLTTAVKTTVNVPGRYDGPVHRRFSDADKPSPSDRGDPKHLRGPTSSLERPPVDDLPLSSRKTPRPPVLAAQPATSATHAASPPSSTPAVLAAVSLPLDVGPTLLGHVVQTPRRGMNGASRPLPWFFSSFMATAAAPLRAHLVFHHAVDTLIELHAPFGGSRAT